MLLGSHLAVGPLVPGSLAGDVNYQILGSKASRKGGWYFVTFGLDQLQQNTLSWEVAH
jgi:hypothetical protein